MNNDLVTSVIEKHCPDCDDIVPVNFFEAFKAKCTICDTVLDFEKTPPPIAVKQAEILKGTEHLEKEIRSDLFPEWWLKEEKESTPVEESPKQFDPFDGVFYDTSESLTEGRNVKPVRLL